MTIIRRVRGQFLELSLAAQALDQQIGTKVTHVKRLKVDQRLPNKVNIPKALKQQRTRKWKKEIKVGQTIRARLTDINTKRKYVHT